MEGKLGAFAGFALDLNISPMCLHNPARNRKTQPGAGAAAARPRSIAAIKALKDVWDVLGADSFAGIANGHIHARGGAPYPGTDSSLRRCMLQRVADEVVEHAPDRLCIDQDGVDIRLHLPLQGNLLLFRKL